MQKLVIALRSTLFVGLMYLALLVLGILFAPLALWSRGGAYWSMKTYCTFVLWLARVLCGLRHEVRGPLPSGDVVVASKHQSFLDIILLMRYVPRPRFVMKKSLRWMPVLGAYAMRIGSTPVDRGKKGQAVAQMLEGVGKSREVAGDDPPGQTIIYPQGTRVAPGAYMRYKIGAALLYDRGGCACIPAATNVGLFWPRIGVMRYPGLAVIEFLEPVEAGLSHKDFLARIESVIEPASDALMREAGFEPPAPPPQEP